LAAQKTDSADEIIHNYSFFENLINSLALTVTGDNSVHCCEKKLYAGSKSARNILTNLGPKPGPTYNSGLKISKTSSCALKLRRSRDSEKSVV